MYIQPTIGVSFNKVTYKGQDRIVSIWDTSGSERYYNITPLYFQNAHTFILVVSVECFNYDTTIRWIRRVQEISIDQPIFIFVNKIDPIDLAIIDIDKEIPRIINEYRLNGWYKMSAYNGDGVNKAFDEVIEVMINRYPFLPGQNSTTINLNRPPLNPPPKKGCCIRFNDSDL
jgi:small GTP-binding protein